MALINIDNGALAKSSVLNDNFIFLDEKIAKTAQTLDAKIGLVSNNASTVTSNLANTQSTVNKINDDLSALTTATEGKASKDLSDVTITESFGSKITEIIEPDLSAGYSIKTGWLSPKAGWVYAYRTGDNFTASLKVDGKNFLVDGSHGGYSNLISGSTFFVGKNKTITFSNYTCTFYPCKGG